MIRRDPGLLHPRLTVVPVAEGPRPAITCGPGRTVVGRAELSGAMEVVAERRRVALRRRIADLQAELEGVQAETDAADAAVVQRRADRDAFADAATWAESVPATIATACEVATAAEAELAERLRRSRDAARALDRVLEQRAQADAAIAEARRQLAQLQSTAGQRAEHQQAADQLAAQARSVEQRLSEAEAEARTQSERTKRDVTEVERRLEELARRQRDELARLTGLVDCLPGESRPPRDEDPVDHVATVAAGLRGLAEVVDGELAGLQAEADRRRADRDARRRQIDAARWSLEHLAPEDAAEALADLVTGVADGLVVLDDVVSGAGGGLLRALEATEPSSPLVLLSSDPAVLGWAIDLPADRGALAGPATVDLLTHEAPASPPRQHALTTSPGEHR